MNRSKRLPPWIRCKLPAASTLAQLRGRTYARGLATVCREARCPNQGHCAERGTATFLILGDRCTRDCGFCAVRHGVPRPVNPDEPYLVAESVVALGLRHAVITSVTRDDLPDGGASLFAATVLAVRQMSPGTTVEVLVPDFQGCPRALQTVIEAAPDVIGHNVETVPRLYPVLRARASYERSVALLERVSLADRGILTKSGIMLGVGEARGEVLDVINDLKRVGLVVFTIGQYLLPSLRHHPVHRYVPPEEFHLLRQYALGQGIRRVESGPLIRSSYHADKIVADLKR